MEVKKRSKILIIVSVIIGVVIIASAAIAAWYVAQLRPVDPDDTEEVVVSIEPGTAPDAIAQMLEEKKLVRSAFVFSVYAKVNGVSSRLQAGAHRLTSSQSVPEIATALQSAQTEEKVVQFVPGAMLRDNSDTTPENRQDVRSALEKLGYDRAEIERAFAADYSEYNDTLFMGRPDGADIEGYVWGETYHVAADATVEQILRHTFDEFVKKIEENDLVVKFERQGLSLFEGITLASVVQKEVSCHGAQVCDDQKKVAQVFFKRLHDGISLGADATFMYAAAQAGERPTVDFDSPYNTRIHRGLTPGPISTPGLGALLAVADPAEGDYLFFVSGDDGVNYFTRTEAEHIEATRKYCHVKCLLP